MVMLEILAAFIVYPLKTGKVYYRLIRDENFIYVYDSMLGYALRRNMVYKNPTPPGLNAPRRIMNADVRTDSNGFLFTEDVKLLKDRLIFCIGGSTTEGSSSRHDMTYPAVLDKLVKGLGYRCINAGVGGYRSIHEMILFKNKILPLNPSAVIIFSGYNDFEESAYGNFKPYNQHSHSLSHSLPRNSFLRYSAFYHFSKRLYYRLSGRIRKETASPKISERMKRALDDKAWADEWRNNIGEIADLCVARNIRCYVLGTLSPTFDNAPKEAKDFADKDLNMCGRFDIYRKFVKLINEMAEKLCEEKKIGFLDFVSDLDRLDYKDRYMLFVDRMHFTEKGNAYLADMIFQSIRKDL